VERQPKLKQDLEDLEVLAMFDLARDAARCAGLLPQAQAARALAEVFYTHGNEGITLGKAGEMIDSLCGLGWIIYLEKSSGYTITTKGEWHLRRRETVTLGSPPMDTKEPREVIPFTGTEEVGEPNHEEVKRVARESEARRPLIDAGRGTYPIPEPWEPERKLEARMCHEITFKSASGQSVPGCGDFIRDQSGQYWIVIRIDISPGLGNTWLATMAEPTQGEIHERRRFARLFELAELIR